jgi:hypothetical protein
MNQLHPRQDHSGGHAGTSSRITRQDLMRKPRHPVITPGGRGYKAPQSLSQRC